MSKISNVLMMLQLLQNGKKYSIKELSEKLEVSPRMVRQYKDELEYAGIFVETIRGPYGGYRLNQNIKIPDKYIRSNSLENVDKKYIDILKECIKNKNKCYIEYYSKDKKNLSYRTICPYELVILDNKWGVAAYCELKNEIRHFVVDRIRKLEIIDENF